MKKATIYTIIIAACALMTGCATDGEELTSATTKLSVSVSDNGFANADGTRASESDYATTFTSGDEIGVFAVVGGKVSDAANNVKMTYDGSSWTGDLYDIAGATYYAYYPYQSKLTGNLVSSETTADGFFTNVISSWTVKLDQSQYADYTASDLMAAKATASNGKLSFTMAHKMALMMVAPPKFEYTYTNTEGGGTGSFSKPITLDWSLPDGFAPYEHGGKYRYIYNGTITVKAIFDEKVFTQTLTCDGSNRGTCQVLTIDGGTTTKQEIKVGDYFMSGGTIKSQSATLSDGEQADVIGYVFYLGQHKNDESDYSATGIGQEKCHGYVISKKIYENNRYRWYPEDYLEDIETIKNETNINSLTWWSGYYYTQEIKKSILALYDKYTKGLATNKNIYAAIAATSLDAPANTSGWFLPTARQIEYVFRDVNELVYDKTGMEGYATYFWTSSEITVTKNNQENTTDYACLWSTKITDVQTKADSYKKNLTCYFCPVLAF